MPRSTASQPQRCQVVIWPDQIGPNARRRSSPGPGLTLPHSPAAVEGNVNRIKMIKRQMHGRAGFALLRKRVILHPG